MYLYESKNWPKFFWNQAVIEPILSDTKFRQGKLLGRMENLGFSLQERATLETLTKEALKTSEIEGERLNENQVRSSIARHLGIEVGGLVISDRHVDGLVRLLLDKKVLCKSPEGGRSTHYLLCGFSINVNKS